jgi:CheY-like chemotaxis protein
MNGYEVADEIQGMFRSGELDALPPLVAATASATEGTLDEAKAHGFAHILAKPFSSGQVASLLAALHPDSDSDSDSPEEQQTTQSAAAGADDPSPVVSTS